MRQALLRGMLVVGSSHEHAELDADLLKSGLFACKLEPYPLNLAGGNADPVTLFGLGEMKAFLWDAELRPTLRIRG